MGRRSLPIIVVVMMVTVLQRSEGLPDGEVMSVGGGSTRRRLGFDTRGFVHGTGMARLARSVRSPESSRRPWRGEDGWASGGVY